MAASSALSKCSGSTVIISALRKHVRSDHRCRSYLHCPENHKTMVLSRWVSKNRRVWIAHVRVSTCFARSIARMHLCRPDVGDSCKVYVSHSISFQRHRSVPRSTGRAPARAAKNGRAPQSGSLSLQVASMGSKKVASRGNNSGGCWARSWRWERLGYEASDGAQAVGSVEGWKAGVDLFGGEVRGRRWALGQMLG